jgi:adenosylhomocysteine nucleosidase
MIKTIGIMGAMDLEIELLRDNMKLISKENIAGFNYYIGRIGGKNIILTCCGVGKVNAACCTQILIDRFKVDYIINSGIAGGLHKEVKICDIVISDNVTYHDVRKNQMRSCFPFKGCFEGDKYLIDIAIKACEITKKENYHVGRIVSGEYFVSDKNIKNNIIEEYNPHCVEMEGAAIGHVAYLNKIPFVVIRSISDNADNDANMDYDAFEKISAEVSAKLVLNMIDMI